MSWLIEVEHRFIDIDAIFWVRYQQADPDALDPDYQRPYLQVFFRGYDSRFEVYGDDVDRVLTALQQRKERDERNNLK